jgi:diguanylate cyclase (GGDEF)-like protein/PAS domain S-box-containing protein
VKLSHNARSVARIVVLASAVFLGTTVGILIVPARVFGKIHPNSIPDSFLCVVIAGTIAFVCAGVWLLGLTEDKQHRLDRDLLDTFLEYIPDNVFFKDRDSRFIRISHSMARYCGLEHPSQMVEKTDAEVFSPEHAARALADERQILENGQPIADKEEKETWPDGRETWVLTTKVAMKDRFGQMIGTMGIAHNITDRKEAELRVRHMALHDGLTGLPNRILLQDRLSQAIAFAARHQKQAAVLMFDLDRFKYVNDSFGHFIGDRLLEGVASRLREGIRKSDTIARLGGDEFVVALPIVASMEEAEAVARKVLATVSQPFEIEGHQLHVSASIGICLYPRDAETPELLLQYADAAMYEAKKRGRNRHCFFSPSFTEATQRQQRLESDLVQACAREEFVLHYQPFVDSKSGRITGVEALLRWNHPQLGMIPPDQFIPELEELGLIVDVGRWILRNACRQAVHWQRLGIPPVRMAVNISSKQLYQDDFVGIVASVLDETGLEPELLELELTERGTLDDSETTIRIMHDLKRLGVKLSLDDFGTGWSSLAYLRRFPVDRIKIDRSFVRDIGTQSTAAAVVKSILSLGRNLGMDCIAEGVETHHQSHFLTKQTCSEMQGFLFSPPVPEKEMVALLRLAEFDRPNASHAKVPAITAALAAIPVSG